MDSSDILKKLSDGDITNIASELKVALNGPGHSALARRALPRIANLCRTVSGRTEPVLKDDEEVLHLALLCSEAMHADIKGYNSMEWDVRVIKSVHAILSKFCFTPNIVCSIKVLEAYLPLFEKMAPSQIEADFQLLLKYLPSISRLVHSANDSFFKNDSHDKITPAKLWTLILQCSSLVSSCESITTVMNMMKFLSIKNQECNQHSNVQKVEDFNVELLKKFVASYQLKVSKLIAKEDDVDKFFAALVTCLWQFLRSDLSSSMAKNWTFILESFSSFADSYIICNQRHLNYFNLTSTIYSVFYLVQPPSEEAYCAKLQSLLSSLKYQRNQGKSSAFIWVLYSGRCAVNALETFSESAACKSFLTPKTVSPIFDFVNIVSESYLSCDTSCSWIDGGEVCQHKGDIFMAFKTVQSIVNICLHPKKFNAKEWSELLPLIQCSIDLLEKTCYTAIREKCSKSESSREIFYLLCSRVGDTCCKFNHWKEGQMFFLKGCKTKFSSTRDTSNFQQSLTDILQRLSICCERQGLFKEAKVAVLLAIVLNLKNGSSFHSQCQNQWSRLQNGDPTGVSTLVQLAERESIALKSVWPDFYIDSKFVPSILLWELSCYAYFRMKNSDIILRVWTALKATKPSSFLLLEGSALACQGLFSCCDSVNWCDLVGSSISSWLCEVEDDQKSVALCAAAVHYYTKFLIQAQSHFDENESKVVDVQLYSHNPATVRQPQDVISVDDVCEVRSHFLNLNLEREGKLMNVLESAMNYWNNALQADLRVRDYKNHSVVALSGEYLLQSAYLYKLWGYHAGAARAFQLCHEFAKKMSVDDLSLQALSGLMSTVEVNQDFILEAEELVESLRDHPKSSDLLKIYYASRAFQSLRTNSHAEGLSVLKNVLDFIPNQSTIWYYAYIKFLQASYASLDNLKVNESQFIASNCLNKIIHLVQEKRLSDSPLIFAGLVNQALSLALWIGRFYLKRQMPKEARSYLKLELKLALKLGLATRAAEFICELAFVDLLTENIDETAAKISDLQSILETTDTSALSSDANDCATHDLDDFIVDGPYLSCPKNEVKTLGGSPLLHEKKFSLPIMKHKSFCHCYTCKNSSVQNLWLMSAHLQAKINTLRFCLEESSSIYMQCFVAVRKVNQQLSQNVHLPGRLLQQHEVACTEICLRLDFVDMLVMYERDEQALAKNGDIFDLLKNLRTTERQLMVEALEQKICIISLVEKKKRIQNEQMSSRNLLTATRGSPKPYHDKTPERDMDYCLTPQPLRKNKRLPLTPLKTDINQLIAPKQFINLKAPLDLSPNISLAIEVQKAPKKTQDALKMEIEPKSSESFLSVEEGVNENARCSSSKPPVTRRVPGARVAATSKKCSQAKTQSLPSQAPICNKKVVSNGQEACRNLKLDQQSRRVEKIEVKSKKTGSSKQTSDATEGTKRTTRSTRLEKK